MRSQIHKLLWLSVVLLGDLFNPFCAAWMGGGTITSTFSSRRLGNMVAYGRIQPGTMRYSSSSSSNENDDTMSSVDQRKKEILQEESMNAANLQASAAQLQNWSDDDMQRVLASMENMSPAEKQQLQSMGMDPSLMKQAMQQMKDNPGMRQQVAQLMQSMTPEELLQQSQQAQNFMKMNQPAQSPGVKEAPKVTTLNDSVEDVDEDEEEEDDDDDDDEEEEEPVALDPTVLDAMYKVGEIMSEPPEQGGVTLASFRVLPPISVLMTDNGDSAKTDGDDDDLLLSDRELRECWSQGSLGATRVDRVGFERVWAAVQDKYYNDICEEARERLLTQKKKRGRSVKPSSVAPVTAAATPMVPPVSNAPPMVGATLSPEQLQAQIKNMKDEDLTQMFDQMSNMTPADEARLKAMGVDPLMMKKSASMMKNNPLLRKAATMMMKNTSPEQLMKASQEAQAKMANMSDEEKQRLMDNLK